MDKEQIEDRVSNVNATWGAKFRDPVAWLARKEIGFLLRGLGTASGENRRLRRENAALRRNQEEISAKLDKYKAEGKYVAGRLVEILGTVEDAMNVRSWERLDKILVAAGQEIQKWHVTWNEPMLEQPCPPLVGGGDK